MAASSSPTSSISTPSTATAATCPATRPRWSASTRRLPEILAARCGPATSAIITADHGNDPTLRGTDHTREQVPILGFGPGVAAGPIGRRETFADIGATVAAHLGLPTHGPGRSWL